MITPPPLGFSYNWVGYSWSASTKASTEFSVPRFPWKKPLSADEKANRNGIAIWAGLGGVHSGTIEQIGVYDHVTAGKVGWYGLYEFYPHPSAGIGGPIGAGDKIFASASRSGIHYTLSLRDAGPSHVWSVSIKKDFGHIENTGEVITEDYTYDGRYRPLTPFSPVKAKVSGNPSTQFYTPWGHAVHSGKTVTMVHG